LFRVFRVGAAPKKTTTLSPAPFSPPQNPVNPSNLVILSKPCLRPLTAPIPTTSQIQPTQPSCPPRLIRFRNLTPNKADSSRLAHPVPMALFSHPRLRLCPYGQRRQSPVGFLMSAGQLG